MQRSPSTAGLFSIYAAGRTTTWLVAGRLMALLRWLALAGAGFCFGRQRQPGAGG